MISAETCLSCSYLITWFVCLLLKITLKGLFDLKVFLTRLKMLVIHVWYIWVLNITRKSHNFHAFTQAYLAHAQTNFPAASRIYKSIYIDVSVGASVMFWIIMNFAVFPLRSRLFLFMSIDIPLKFHWLKLIFYWNIFKNKLFNMYIMKRKSNKRFLMQNVLPGMF